VKLYLGMLPEPLLTFGLYEAFLGVMDRPEGPARARALRENVGRLPLPERLALHRLLQVLGPLQEALGREASLAGLFAPLLLRKDLSFRAKVASKDIVRATVVTEALLRDHRGLFEGLGTAPPPWCTGTGRDAGGAAAPRAGGCGRTAHVVARHPHHAAGAERDDAGLPVEAVGEAARRGAAAALERTVGGGLFDDADDADPFAAFAERFAPAGPAAGQRAAAGGADGGRGGSLANITNLAAGREGARGKPATEKPAAPEADRTALTGLAPQSREMQLVGVPTVQILDQKVKQLSLEDSIREKITLKKELRSVDDRFFQLVGRKPTKEEKEHLKPLYLRYWKLKKHIERQKGGWQPGAGPDFARELATWEAQAQGLEA